MLLAFVLSALIGLERELRQKSAGLRTHSLVGVAAALIMLVSKHGFDDVLSTHIELDPSRVAAQIVSGIGVIGVRGLTTAAAIWLTAAVGMAAGGGLPVLAVLVTSLHFVVVFAFPPLAELLPRSKYLLSRVEVTYLDGHGVLREVIETCTQRGFSVSHMTTDVATEPAGRTVVVRMQVTGRDSVPELASAISEIEGVLAVSAGDEDSSAE